MTDPATGYLNLIASFGISGLALLTIIPIGIVIWLDMKMVNWCLKKGGKAQYLGIIASLILSIGSLAYGLWSIWNDFSLVSVFVATGGFLILILTIRLATFINEEDRVKNKYLK
jgi:hypothetical protein